MSIDCTDDIAYELRDAFTFEVPGARFTPQFRAKLWNGKIYLFNVQKKEMYRGLISYIKSFCEERDYDFIYENDVKEKINIDNAKKFIQTLNCKYEPRDYQIDAFLHAINNKRALLLSPTASGKSLIIYLILRYINVSKVLIIVPTTSLVSQLYNDFADYGYDSSNNIHTIFSGRDKQSDMPVVISTWQSLYQLPATYFHQYDAIIGDEAHLFKSKSLTGIMTKLHEAKYRFGFTGTLDGSATHKWVLEGLFGECKHVTKTEKLIKEGHLSDFRIKVLLLKHEKTEFFDYQGEIDAIVDNQKRNRMIKNLVRDLEGNTLVLFNYVERHGMPLYESINSIVKDGRKVFFVYGGVDTEEREEIRKITETENDAVIVASYGTFSTGINIRNLHNVVFASPSKSRVRNLQSIGRVLRKGNNKTFATLYDIADEYCRTPQKNYTLKHLDERLKIYEEENFNVEIIKLDLR